VSYADTIGRAVQTAGVDRVVTRHSSVMTMAELKEFGEFNADFVRDAQTARRRARRSISSSPSGQFRRSTRATRRRPPGGLSGNRTRRSFGRGS